MLCAETTRSAGDAGAGGAVTIRAVLFDLDGTLVDTESLWAQALSAYLGDRGCVCPADDVQRIVLGRAWSDIYSAITTRFPQLARHSMAATGAELRPYYLRLRAELDISISGSVALLKRLAQTYPIAVVSGSPRIDVGEGLATTGTAGLVRFYLGSEDYARGKPDPACFRLAAERLGVPAAQCLVFEDSTAGVRAAKAAGMRCVALRRPGAPMQDLSAADLTLTDLAAFQMADLPER
jgi:beta-phosphoglucomutase-like phosphatase (HAD superfamily)